jgi:hypothetical protein
VKSQRHRSGPPKELATEETGAEECLDRNAQPRRPQFGPFPSYGEPRSRCRHPILLIPDHRRKAMRIATSQACVIENPRGFAEFINQVDGFGNRPVKTGGGAADAPIVTT